MVGLFAEAREAIRRAQNEIALVVEQGGVSVALTVDGVDSVETLEPGSVEDMPASGQADMDHLVASLGKRQGGKEMILLMDVASLLEQARGAARPAA